MLRQQLLDIAAGIYEGYEDNQTGKSVKIEYGLEDVCLRKLGIRLEKGTYQLRYGELRGVPIEQWDPGAREYVLNDTRMTRALCLKQDLDAEFLEDEFRQARAAFWIQLMRTWGLRTDARGVAHLERVTKVSEDAIKGDLIAAGLLRPDRRLKSGPRKGQIEQGSRDVSAAQARMIQVCQDAGKPIRWTDGGKSGNVQPSLDKIACDESGDPILKKYAELTSLRNVLSKDVPALYGGIHQPIHSRFTVLRETGRTSSKKPNVQNSRRLPGIRECFVPSQPGWVYVCADFSTLELFCLAEVCHVLLGYSTLGDALTAGEDPHMRMAEQILGQPYEWLILPDSKELGWVNDARQTGKVANFGFPGGLGPEALVEFAWAIYKVRLTIEQAVELKRQWLLRWPEMTDYFRYVGRETRKDWAQIRHVYSNRYRGGVAYTEACNSRFQGLGADIAKDAGWAIMVACYLDTESPLFGFRICNFVHDEFILEGPEHRAHEAALELSRIMTTVANRWLPHVPGIKAKPIVCRRYSDDAKQVWKDGRLVPWDTSLWQ